MTSCQVAACSPQNLRIKNSSHVSFHAHEKLNVYYVEHVILIVYLALMNSHVKSYHLILSNNAGGISGFHAILLP